MECKGNRKRRTQRLNMAKTPLERSHRDDSDSMSCVIIRQADDKEARRKGKREKEGGAQIL